MYCTDCCAVCVIQSCTCGKGPHCVHILFVMNRVFLLTEQDVLMSAKVLKNFEVSLIVLLQY